jgi:hypothetical protein
LLSPDVSDAGDDGDVSGDEEEPALGFFSDFVTAEVFVTGFFNASVTGPLAQAPANGREGGGAGSVASTASALAGAPIVDFNLDPRSVSTSPGGALNRVSSRSLCAFGGSPAATSDDHEPFVPVADASAGGAGAGAKGSRPLASAGASASATSAVSTGARRITSSAAAPLGPHEGGADSDGADE